MSLSKIMLAAALLVSLETPAIIQEAGASELQAPVNLSIVNGLEKSLDFFGQLGKKEENARTAYSSLLLSGGGQNIAATGFFEQPAGTTELMMAAEGGHLYELQNYNAQLRMQDADGMTALMRAAYAGQLECVEFLKPFELKITGEKGFGRGMTALMWALAHCLCDKEKQEKRIACAYALLEEAGEKDFMNWTALVYASEGNEIDLVKVLSQNPEEAESIDLALKYAEFREGNEELIQVLEEAKEARDANK